ncbi:GNAT family N-acetyltransferase [Natronogracilivirga saccharolytica]|uniref:GNAT family N-acetyltransferase n=1 Tax=Natronogracilivirga saccharolytica TaxID=2812953 RepID=A0A8J7SAS5_9BACT|nr:GNAT family N-acetyltransferase [Natronogracilivirga saccharolytica]MBP3193106.1 GNAT family N-acetyltransferase [Natronogracilivirga saccharolytica]
MIRAFTDNDFDAVLQLLQEALIHDTIDEGLLREKIYGDPDFSYDTTLVAEENESLSGFMQGVLRDVRGELIGYLKLMAVDSGKRKSGVGKEMYEQLESHFISKNAGKIRIFDAPLNYFQPGIDPRYTEALCFAWRMGFERFDDTTNLTADLHARDWQTSEKEQLLAEQGIIVSRADEDDRVELLRFIEKEFELWRHEVAIAYQSDPVAVHIARLNGKIRAFSAYNGNNVGTGWFGPMGTSKELRGKGIGAVLLKRCLKDLRDEGNKQAIIPWVGPIPFYAYHAGAKVDRVFWRFEKKL